MTFEEYRAQDGCGLASLVSTGEVRPEELLELAIARCEELNPQLNALVFRRYEEARREAAELGVASGLQAGAGEAGSPAAGAGSRLRGVPFLLKDLAMHLAGAPMSCGSRSYRGFVSNHDSTVVQRLRDGGLVVFGKSNVPEFGLTPYTESTELGPCRNPWNTDHTPGGSSGGAGAAVAAGVVPLASASDGGGSIRIPASCCGLFGLKPSRGRVPLATEGWGGGVVEGCVSRSVRDTAAYLDLVAGPAPGDFFPTPLGEFTGALRQGPPPRLRIGFSTAHPFAALGAGVHPDCRTVVEGAVRLAGELGHHVEEIPLPWNADIYERDFLPVVVSSTAVEAAEAARIQGRRLRLHELESNTRLMASMGRQIRADAYAAALQRWNETARAFGRLHESYDLICIPTLAQPPAAVGRFESPAVEEAVVRVATGLGLTGVLMRFGLVREMARRVFVYMPFTPPANMTGAPAISVPLGMSADGLPIGVQFMGPMGSDELLLRFAAQLETAAPWFNTVPV